MPEAKANRRNPSATEFVSDGISFVSDGNPVRERRDSIRERRNLFVSDGALIHKLKARIASLVFNGLSGSMETAGRHAQHGTFATAFDAQIIFRQIVDRSEMTQIVVEARFGPGRARSRMQVREAVDR